jgi:Zn-dependent protease/CBS domain-containing protein
VSSTQAPGQNGNGKTTQRLRGVRLGSVFGIEIVADWSVMIVFALVAISLGAGVLPQWHPGWSPVLTWGTALAAGVLFFVSILLHELSHAVVGRLNGVHVGRITLFVFGGMAHMEGEPPTPKAEFLMAVVGPLMSLMLGVLSIAIGTALADPSVMADAARSDDPTTALQALGPAPTLFLWLGPINLVLGLFNLVPGFPLDGGRILRAILWWSTGSMQQATRWSALAGQAVAWTLIASGMAMAFGLEVPLFGEGFLSGLWLVLIGWFLNNAARASYQQLLVRQSLTGVRVADVMRSHLETIAPEMRLSELVRDYAMASDQRAFPVVSADRLIGIVTLRDIRRVPSERWAQTRANDIMTPLESVSTLAPEEEATEALRLLSDADVEQLAVVEEGRVRGIVRRQDLVRWLTMHHARA